jgi:hypothetical protein
MLEFLLTILVGATAIAVASAFFWVIGWLVSHETDSEVERICFGFIATCYLAVIVLVIFAIGLGVLECLKR